MYSALNFSSTHLPAYTLDLCWLLDAGSSAGTILGAAIQRKDELDFALLHCPFPAKNL
jgi:hypothetical protein